MNSAHRTGLRLWGPALLAALLAASACGGRASEAEIRAAHGELPREQAAGATPAAATSTDGGPGALAGPSGVDNAGAGAPTGTGVGESSSVGAVAGGSSPAGSSLAPSASARAGSTSGATPSAG
ncbi:MAG TPA: hypothetical protein VGR20_22425, partial [Acidimicrobiia bacterium]|nr:hypothetical protein [Acidimicrobiia bacterium]